MTLAIRALVLVSLLACDEVPQRPPSEWQTGRIDLSGIDGLSDCALFSVKTPASLPNLYVVRCPASSTTTTWHKQQGKQRVQRQVTAVDGGP